MAKLKKTAAMLLAAAALASCGRGGLSVDYAAKARESLSSNYTFDAQIYYGENTAQLTLEKTGPQSISMEFTAPEDLSGLEVFIEDGDLSIYYRDMEIDLSDYDLPSQSVISGLWEVLGAGADNSLTAEATDDTVVARGGVYIYTFIIEFDKSDMSIKKITLPNLSAYADITNFKFAA